MGGTTESEMRAGSKACAHWKAPERRSAGQACKSWKGLFHLFEEYVEYGIVDEKRLRVTLGERVQNKMSNLVRPEDFPDLAAFLAAAQAEWDAVWAALHK